MVAPAIGGLCRIKKGRRFRTVAELARLDLEEADARQSVEQSRQSLWVDLERRCKFAGTRRAAAEPSEQVKLQPGTHR
jgi:hypothetical protein